MAITTEEIQEIVETIENDADKMKVKYGTARELIVKTELGTLFLLLRPSDSELSGHWFSLMNQRGKMGFIYAKKTSGIYNRLEQAYDMLKNRIEQNAQAVK